MANKQRKTGAKGRPEWGAQASQLAHHFGLSDADVKREIRGALARLIAEEIARDEVKKWRSAHPRESDLDMVPLGAGSSPERPPRRVWMKPPPEGQQES
ncbi:MAG: hypothetical protein HY726_08985 [Candidatus Rokubacteria bacterium]|nr:hypothetical protein [Candidatus Rokubacteria bacterium]